MAQRFRAIVVFEGLLTGEPVWDKRLVISGALTARALPLALREVRELVTEDDVEVLVDVVGRIDTLTREDASTWVDEATGQTWTDVAGGKVYAWVAEGELSDQREGAPVGVAVDLVATKFEEHEGTLHITSGEIAAVTLSGNPAFRGCTIELIGA
jgi:hypothetical protein